MLPPGREWMAKLALLHNKGCHRCGVGQGAARELAHECIETDVVLSHRAAVAEVGDAGQEAGHVELLWPTWTMIVVGWQRVRGRDWTLVEHVHRGRHDVTFGPAPETGSGHQVHDGNMSFNTATDTSGFVRDASLTTRRQTFGAAPANVKMCTMDAQALLKNFTRLLPWRWFLGRYVERQSDRAQMRPRRHPELEARSSSRGCQLSTYCANLGRC